MEKDVSKIIFAIRLKRKREREREKGRERERKITRIVITGSISWLLISQTIPQLQKL